MLHTHTTVAPSASLPETGESLADRALKDLGVICQLSRAAIHLGTVAFSEDFNACLEKTEAIAKKFSELSTPPTRAEVLELHRTSGWDNEGIKRLLAAQRAAVDALELSKEFLARQAGEIGLEIKLPEKQLQRVQELLTLLHSDSQCKNLYQHGVDRISQTKDDLLLALRDFNRAIHTELSGFMRAPLQVAAEMSQALLDSWSKGERPFPWLIEVERNLHSITVYQRRVEEVSLLFADHGTTTQGAWEVNFKRPGNLLRQLVGFIEAVVSLNTAEAT